MPAAPATPTATASANLKAALALLLALRRAGLRQAVICPGSRSAPLAVAAALLEPTGLALHTALDERSAGFFALGLGLAAGSPAAVITTSGSAVAQLLPACVEADHGAIALLVLSADRPQRLKGCGANQSVNQETFLRDSCRWFGQGDPAGLAAMDSAAITALALHGYAASLGVRGGLPAGAVHLNLPLEEPLHADGASLVAIAKELDDLVAAGGAGTERVAGAAVEEAAALQGQAVNPGQLDSSQLDSSQLDPGQLDPGQPDTLPRLDPDRPGLVVAGPWRGSPAAWPQHLEALVRWQRRSGWPVLADALSGLRGHANLACVAAYDLLLDTPSPALACPQVLRLGSLPSSRRLERWLAGLDANQLLVSEGEPRRLDPLKVVAAQYPLGLASWLAAQPELALGAPAAASLALAGAWRAAETQLQHQLNQQLNQELSQELNQQLNQQLSAAAPSWSEPALARQLSRLLPAGLPLMLANSSPVRDWACFADPAAPPRPIHGFRGASGIDGTLSEACGLAEALGALVLLSGDLALLHDANGWLWRPQLRGRLTVVLVDNQGGGIFEQLPIRAQPAELLDFERLFAMPQAVDPIALAGLHGVPARRVERPADLPDLLSWALRQPFSLLVVNTDRRRDAQLRQRLRTMAPLEPTP